MNKDSELQQWRNADAGITFSSREVIVHKKGGASDEKANYLIHDR